MISAILNGDLNKAVTVPDPIFGVLVPQSCPKVPSEILNPRNTWKNGQAYDEKARELAIQFVENFKEYESPVDAKILAAGPRIPDHKKATIKKIK